MGLIVFSGISVQVLKCEFLCKSYIFLSEVKFSPVDDSNECVCPAEGGEQEQVPSRCEFDEREII